MSGRSSGLSARSRSRSPSRHSRVVEPRHGQGSIVCKPLDSLSDITEFLKNPPAWRSLCSELRPHSDDLIRNMDIVRQNHPESDHEIKVENPEAFCHFNAAADDVHRHRRKDLPQTLVCHDMANGYHDDSIIDGTGNYDAYTFYNWAAVDIFCYFSHHFITIPPLGWINVGHAHGVKVIGTVITEWADGAATWDGLLAAPEEWQAFAGNLVAIAKALKFDGWLLNIENPISRPLELLRFVRHLRALLHRELPAPVLVWYDSVTISGALAWQNRLNEHNKAFFDACDAMFTNYSWSEHDVRATRVAAGARARDVCVGVDVWGRNFVAGGQFNTQQALKIIHKHGLSVAIFAQGWTHEAMEEGPPATSRLQWFLLRDRALWGSLWPFLNTKLPSALPFSTSFCLGAGRKRRLYGEVICPVPWYNLRHQQYQPNAALGAHGYRLRAHQEEDQLDCQLTQANEQTADGTAKETDKDYSICQTSQIDIERGTSVEAAKETDNVDRSNCLQKRVKEFPKEISKCQDLQTANEKVSEETATEVKNNVEEVPQIVANTSSRPATQTKHPRSPKRYELSPLLDEAPCLELFLEDSFTGGGCLLVNPFDENDSNKRLIRLFHTDFAVETFIACVVTKTLPDYEEQFLNILLSVRDQSGRESRVVLVGSSGGDAGTDAEGVHAVSGQAFKDVQRYLLLHQPGFYVSVENPYGWKVRYFSVRARRARILSVSCGGARGPVLLGHFGLCHRLENMD